MNLWQTIKSELDGPIETVRKSLSGALDMAEDLTSERAGSSWRSSRPAPISATS